MMKKINSILLALFLLLLIPVTAMAAGSVDTEAKGTLTVSCKFGDLALKDVPVKLYRICKVKSTGELEPLEGYTDYDQLTKGGKDDEAWRELAAQLETKLLEDETLPDYSSVTGEDGIARFTELPVGLYLILGTQTQVEGYIYKTTPSFVLLPQLDKEQNTWNYRAAVTLKPAQSPVLQDLTVYKKWKDSCHTSRRPKSITVKLLCDGEQYGDSVELSSKTDWKYTWKDLDVNHEWTVSEDKLTGYKNPVITKTNDTTFVITNTCSDPGGSWLPQTGQLWWPVPLLIAGGLACLIIGLLRRRKR